MFHFDLSRITDRNSFLEQSNLRINQRQAFSHSMHILLLYYDGHTAAMHKIK